MDGKDVSTLALNLQAWMDAGWLQQCHTEMEQRSGDAGWHLLIWGREG